jgi:hypothetical protein
VLSSLESLSRHPERDAAAASFKKTSILIASLFALRAQKMSEEGRGTFMTSLIPLAKGEVEKKTGEELASSFIQKLEDLRKIKPNAPEAYKKRDISFILENENIFVTIEMAQGIIRQCLEATNAAGQKYFDTNTIVLIWTHVRNLMISASNYIKFTPEVYPDPNIIKGVWL